MRPYLNNFIDTLSDRRQTRASNLLEEARVGKDQLSRLADRLSEISEFDVLSLARDRHDSRINPVVITGNANSIESRVRALFDVSNLISLLVNSHASALSSEVKALEDELVAMEKMAHNFAFLFSENQAYDYAHLESFTDERGRSDMTIIPDRTGLNFGPAQFASIRVDEGVLSLPESTAGSHGLTGRLVRGNSTALTIHETDLENVFREGNTNGWRMTIAVPGPVTAPLKEGLNRSGAQVVLEFELTDPAPSSEIKLVPFADMPLEVLQVTIYDDEDDTVGIELLSTPRRLDRALTLHFPMKSVHHFRIVLNQTTFHRVTSGENDHEFRYRVLIEDINHLNKKSRFVRRSFSINKIEQSIQSRVMQNHRSISLPSTELQADEGPMMSDKIANLLRSGRFSDWEDSGEKERIILRALEENGDEFDINKLRRDGGDLDITKFSRYLATDEEPVLQVIDRFVSLPVRDMGFNYLYNIGLHRVRIGVESPGFKGVFVSKAFPSEGDIGEIRIKASDDNYSALLSDRHTPWMTSVEYSVSNQSEPISEEDWVPILPVGVDSVEGERMFIDDGRGYFRFPARDSWVIHIYRNGYRFQPDSFIQGGPGELIGVRFDEKLIAPDDIFTCDYEPVGEPTVINFHPYGFDEPALVFAHDENGSGEGFSSTGERNTVKLGSYPYIDPELAAEGGFQPIVVQLSTGETAENLTDYRSGHTAPFPEDDGYYYIHSGNKLIFNKRISIPFRVYYEYLENNVRVRAVLRCNSKDFVSPQVDYIHAKAKTRRAEKITS